MACPLHHRSHSHRYYCHTSIVQTPSLICNSCYSIAWRYSSSTIAAVVHHRVAEYLLHKSSSSSSEESPTWFELEGEQSSSSASKFHRPCFLSYSYPMPIQIPPFRNPRAPSTVAIDELFLRNPFQKQLQIWRKLCRMYTILAPCAKLHAK